MKLTIPLVAISFCTASLPAQAQNWDGWHGGLQLGAAQAEGPHDITLDGFTFGLDEPVGLDEIDGRFFGLRGGRDWMRGQVVFGVEAAISKTDIEDFFANETEEINDNDFYETKINSLSTIRGRIGHVVGAQQNTLVYGIAGLAIADVTAQNGDADPDVNDNLVRDCTEPTGACAKGSETAIGYTVGLGVEHQLTNVQIGRGNLSLGLEYAYHDFGDVEFDTKTNVAMPEDHEFDVDLSAHTLQAIVRVRF